ESEVQPPVLVDGLVDGRLDVVGVAHVTGDRSGGAASLVDLVDDTLGDVDFEVIDDDFRTTCGEIHGDGLSDPGAPARDERNFSFKLGHLLSSVVRGPKAHRTNGAWQHPERRWGAS